nr:hypothetical protein [Maribacter aestuarii]
MTNTCGNVIAARNEKKNAKDVLKLSLKIKRIKPMPITEIIQ